MAWNRGDVVLVDFPFIDRFGSKFRPALIVSGTTYHNERPQDVIVAVISSQVQKYTGQTDYLLKDWQTAGLAQPSVVRSTLLTILSARITRKIGDLSNTDLHEVEFRFKLTLEL
jgi:mRNA interferase MazF